MLTLYARREPTTDTVAKTYAPHAKLNDVVFYRDEDAMGDKFPRDESMEADEVS